jgi:hypothetical protein
MFACKSGVPNHCLVMDFGQAACFSHAIAFGNVFVNGDDGFVGQSGIEKDGSLAFGKGFFAVGAVQ